MMNCLRPIAFIVVSLLVMSASADMLNYQDDLMPEVLFAIGIIFLL